MNRGKGGPEIDSYSTVSWIIVLVSSLKASKHMDKKQKWFGLMVFILPHGEKKKG